MKSSVLSEKGKVVVGKGEVFERLEHLFYTYGDEKPTLRWQLTNEQTKRGGREHLMLEVTRRHCQFIQVSK